MENVEGMEKEGKPGEDLQSARITCDRLVSLMEQSSNLLLFDLRSFLAFNKAHVNNAINVCIPKIVKRQGFTVKNIESGLCKNEKDILKRREGSIIVLYDQNGTELDPGSLLTKCFEALVQEGLCLHVYWLEGGFTKFQQDYPNKIRNPAKNAANMIRNRSMSAAPVTAPADLTISSEPIVEISSYLFLSGAGVAQDYDELKKHNIHYIINAAAEVSDSFSNLPEFSYKRLELQDHPAQNISITAILESAFKTIEEAKVNGRAVLVHCLAGRSRSATIVIAYLMKANRWSLQQAYEYVQQKNPKVSPNLGFMGQLMTYETHLRKVWDRHSSEYLERERRSSLEFQLLQAEIQAQAQPEPERPPTPKAIDAMKSFGTVSLGVHS